MRWFACLLLSVVPSLAEETDPYRAFYASFADKACCWTSRCCYEISAADVVDLGGNRFKIVASGQVVERKGASPDGGYHRCACDPVVSHEALAPSPQQWWIHPAANTRCLFTPDFGS
jgi:hypothetical protein